MIVAPDPTSVREAMSEFVYVHQDEQETTKIALYLLANSSPALKPSDSIF